MRIPLDRQSSTPLYQQIEAYLRESILSGGLPPETRLPSTRQLAQDLGVNRITVENAYAGLETEGLVYSRTGSGTFVIQPAAQASLPPRHPGAAWPMWQQDLEALLGQPETPTPQQMLQAAGHPNPINFADGAGDSNLFPVDDFRKVFQFVMRQDGVTALEYGEYQGYEPLRNNIAHILASQGLQASPEDVLVTAGSQEALAMVSQILLKPGDGILVENPSYAGGLDLFRLLGYRLVGVPVDEHGMQVEKLETLLQQHHPRLIYTMPTFQNPTGTCMSLTRRRMLISLADRYNVPILEDDFVGDLRYDGRALPALKALDPGGRVIYVGTFSKMLMPGIRLGFVMAEGPLYNSLVHFKHVSELTTSNLSQRALNAYVTVGRYQAHLRRSVMLYRKRRDAMAQTIHRYLPGGVRFDLPQGGLFIWLCLPDGLSAQKLLPLAIEEGVAFAPGASFFPSQQEGECYLRLNFVSYPPESIETGIRRLGKAIRKLQAS